MSYEETNLAHKPRAEKLRDISLVLYRRMDNIGQQRHFKKPRGYFQRLYTKAFALNYSQFDAYLAKFPWLEGTRAAW